MKEQDFGYRPNNDGCTFWDVRPWGMIRRCIFRILVGLLLAVSPIAFPVLLMVADTPVNMSNLGEFYGEVWRTFLRGFA